MSPKDIFSQVRYWIVNLYLKSYTFCFYFILFSYVWIRIRILHSDPDPQSSWIRIQYGSGSGSRSTTLITYFNVLILPEGRNDVEDQHPAQVEEEMDEGNLQGGLAPRAVCRQAGNNTRRRCSNVGAKGERVGPLQAHQTGPGQRRQRGREHAAGLEKEGEQRADGHGQVAGEPGHVGQVGVDAGLDEAGYPAAEDAVEDVDNGEEAAAHEEEGGDGQQQAHRDVSAGQALRAQVGQQVAAGGRLVVGDVTTATRGQQGRDVLIGGVIAGPPLQYLHMKNIHSPVKYDSSA